MGSLKNLVEHPVFKAFKKVGEMYGWRIHFGEDGFKILDSLLYNKTLVDNSIASSCTAKPDKSIVKSTTCPHCNKEVIISEIIESIVPKENTPLFELKLEFKLEKAEEK